MRFQFSFRHMDVSPALQNYTETKIKAQIDRFVTKAIDATVTFSVERHQHHAHCAIVGGDGFSLQVEHSGDDMYVAVDRMVDKIAAQLKKKKEKLKDHKAGPRNVRSVTFGKGNQDGDAAEVDAEDIIKFETARKRLATN